jgi:hypothetical protein
MPDRLPSGKVVLFAPLSFRGSVDRAWKLTHISNPVLRWITIPFVILLIFFWWCLVAVWYVLVGLVLWPWAPSSSSRPS